MEYINLDNDEEIIYSGESHVNKTDTQIPRFILAFFVILVFWFLYIKFIIGSGIDSIIFFIVLLLFTGLLIYGLLHNVLLKRNNSNNKYFISNKKVYLIDSNKQIKSGIISDIMQLSISHEKDGYGDLGFVFYGDSMIDMMKKSIEFSGITNVREVAYNIKKYNEKIIIVDDKPTGIFAKKK